MEKFTEAVVIEKIRVLDQVAIASRVMLGIAVGMGFFVSAYAVFQIPPDWGLSGTVPLKISSIVDAKAIMNADEQFVPLNYSIGDVNAYQQTGIITGTASDVRARMNQPLTITLGAPTIQTQNNVTGSTSFSIETPSPVTSFSIEPVGGAPPYTNTNTPPANVYPAQMLVLAYKMAGDSASAAPRMLTICVGHTSVSTLYVATDGSTYANSSFGVLNGRTTNETCAMIKSRTMRMTQVNSGTLVTDQGDYASGEYQFARAFFSLGKFSANQFTPSTSFVNLQTEAPLFASFNFSEVAPTKPNAPAIITLKQTTGTLISYTLCFPSANENMTTGGPVYYFDIYGSPFRDIFLSQPVLAGKCSDILAKSLKLTVATSGTIVTEGQAPTVDINVSQGNHTLGKFTADIFSPNTGVITYGNSDPLVIAPATYQTGTSGSMTFPRSILTLAGTYSATADVIPTPVTATLCYPQTTWAVNTQGARSWYFYDKDGNPYTDLFLQTPAMTTKCSDIVAGTYPAGSISTVTANRGIDADHGVWVASGSYLYGVLGSDGWHDRQGQQGTYQKLPLVLALTGSNALVDVPSMQISITTKSGQSQTLCWGGFKQVTAGDKKTIVFYGRDGKGYTDLFLTQPFTCPLAVARYSNIHVISVTSTSATIGWDTDIPTCGRINYGKITNQLNSGPIADSCYGTTKAPFTTGHQATITGLTKSTKYLYEIVSTNNSVSGQQTFTTTAATGVPQPILVPND